MENKDDSEIMKCGYNGTMKCGYCKEWHPHKHWCRILDKQTAFGTLCSCSEVRESTAWNGKKLAQQTYNESDNEEKRWQAVAETIAQRLIDDRFYYEKRIALMHGEIHTAIGLLKEVAK